MINPRTSKNRPDEGGAIAIIVAIMMVSLCVAAAMVLDLGLLRVDRQEDKSAQDSAAVAGANGLVASLASPAPFHPFAGVCQALNYLKVNSSKFKTFSSESWQDGNGAVLGGSGFGCTPAQAAAICTASTPTTWARFRGVSNDGKTTVFIQSGYTVSGGNISTVTGGDFSEESMPAFAGDTGDATYGGCDQVAVFVVDSRDTTFGNAAGVSKVSTRLRSVARVHIAPPQSPFALLVLERTDCQVLTNGNNGVAAINVNGYKTHPGLIHADSDGSGASCNKQIIVGQKADGVVAHEAPDTNAPGSISTVATSNQSDALANVYAGPASSKSAPVSSGQVTRSVVDSIYLNGVKAAVASSAFAWTAAAPPVTVPDGTWTKINSCPSGNVPGTKLLVNCGNMNNSATFTQATDIIFTGTLGGGSSTIKMPKAQNVYVVGSGQPNGVGVQPGTLLSMHDNDSACSSTFDPAASRAKLVVFGGSLTVSGGTFRACNTTVILMGNDSTGCLPASSPTYYPLGKVCNGLTKVGNGVVNMTGNGTVDWTAPNLDTDEEQASQADHDALEDLALWNESYGSQGLGGSGTVHLAGVYVAPNAKPLKLNGTPTWQVLNSQYVVRTLENDGGAIFNLQPLPSLPVAPPTVTFELVR
jgi:hypothetical protein